MMLHRNLGWRGLLLDGDHEMLSENLHKEYVTPENVVSIFDEHRVPREPDFVSIDIDGCDLWVFLNLTEFYRPRVISIEYNPNYQYGESKSVICNNQAGEK